MKRTKNSRKMHMVFNVQSGTVEVKVHENEFTVHRGGIWQVPRGMFYLSYIFISPIFLSRTASAKHALVFANFGTSRRCHLAELLSVCDFAVCSPSFA
jgi:hypothetical protein